LNSAFRQLDFGPCFAAGPRPDFDPVSAAGLTVWSGLGRSSALSATGSTCFEQVRNQRSSRVPFLVCTDSSYLSSPSEVLVDLPAQRSVLCGLQTRNTRSRPCRSQVVR
jgi:hypothetical protein